MQPHVNKLVAFRLTSRKMRGMPDDSAQKLETKFEVKTTAELGARFNAVCNRRSAPVAAVLRQLIEAFCDSAGKEGLGPAAPFDIRSKQSKPK